jgi:xanthine dehydrogenase accessory factor
LGRILAAGSAEPDTGVPGPIAGFTVERLLSAPAEGEFRAWRRIGDAVATGEAVGAVGASPVVCRVDGVLRGLIRSGTAVRPGLKVGDIDPRGKVSYCFTISDKARAIAGSVLEAVLRIYNR